MAKKVGTKELEKNKKKQNEVKKKETPKPFKKPLQNLLKKIEKKQGPDADKPISKEKPSFDQTRKVDKLSLLFVIVNKGQGIGIYKILKEKNCSLFLSMFGNGTAAKYLDDLIGGQYDSAKEIVLGIVTENAYQNIKPLIEKRFSISEATKGVAFRVDFSKMVSVFSYRFLANVRN